MQRSPEQEACVEAMLKTSDNLIVRSCAGSGKTTTGRMMILDGTPESTTVLACAFNKRNAIDFESKMPQARITKKTLNGLGHRAWIRRVKKIEKVDERKTWRIASALKVANFPDLAKAVGVAKARGLVPNGALGGERGLVPDEDDRYTDLLDDHDIDCGECENPIDAIRDCLLKSIEWAWRGDIDFDDQIYMSTIFKGDFDHYDLIMVDEVQDLSAIQHAMLKRIARGKSRIIALGDEHQCIYGFRGALSNSMDLFAQSFDCKERALTFSFRCPQAVVAEARRFVQHINPAPTAPMGSVSRLDHFHPDTFKRGDVVLCRNTSPVVELAFTMIASGISARVLGREIGEGLLKMLKHAHGGNRDEVVDSLRKYAAAKSEEYVSREKFGKAEGVRDRAASITAIASRLATSATVQDIQKRIEQIFSSDRADIELSTIHKAKGLEWPRVFFLDSELIPSKFATSPEDLQQESNVAYVGVTRAMQDLIYIRSKGVW